MTNKRTTAAVVTALAGCAFAASNTVALADTSGGAEPGTTTTTVKPKPKPKPKKPVPRFPIKTEQDLTGVLITQYWSVPERWFKGVKIKAPGLKGLHRVDWLYSSSGVAMEGDGTAESGAHVHWVSGGHWMGGSQGLAVWPPFWLNEGFWWTKAPAGHRKVTFRLSAGGWSRGKGVIWVPPKYVRFGNGASRPLKDWGSIAVDPKVISFGSAVKIPYRRNWLCAQDTGGAIKGRHIDVYRPAPATRGGGSSLSHAKLHVLPPAVARRKIHGWRCTH